MDCPSGDLKLGLSPAYPGRQHVFERSLLPFEGAVSRFGTQKLSLFSELLAIGYYRYSALTTGTDS